MQSNRSISVLVPVYNEEHLFPSLLERVEIVLCKLKSEEIIGRFEIIVVDDGSSDETTSFITSERYPYLSLIKLPENRGKGHALRKGIEICSGDIIIFQDGDLEYDPMDYIRLITPIIRDDEVVVFGTRFVSNELDRFIPSRYFANRFLTRFYNILTGCDLTDMETGYKVFRADILKSLGLRSDRFTIEPEIAVKLAKKKIRICEIPISYRGRSYAEGKKIGWRDGLEAVFAMIRFAFSK